MRSWIKLSLWEAGWAPISVFLFSLLLGNIFHIYSLFPGIDKTVHIGGGMAIAHFFATSIFHSQKIVGTIQSDRQLLFTLGLTLLVAVAWEGIELFGDFAFKTKTNHGLTDTLLDILFGLLGSLIVLFFRAGKETALISHQEKDKHISSV
jgi:hypothetical protein